jgi:hypothetical protein
MHSTCIRQLPSICYKQHTCACISEISALKVEDLQRRRRASYTRRIIDAAMVPQLYKAMQCARVMHREGFPTDGVTPVATVETLW